MRAQPSRMQQRTRLSRAEQPCTKTSWSRCRCLSCNTSSRAAPKAPYRVNGMAGDIRQSRWSSSTPRARGCRASCRCGEERRGLGEARAVQQQLANHPPRLHGSRVEEADSHPSGGTDLPADPRVDVTTRVWNKALDAALRPGADAAGVGSMPPLQAHSRSGRTGRRRCKALHFRGALSRRFPDGTQADTPTWPMTSCWRSNSRLMIVRERGRRRGGNALVGDGCSLTGYGQPCPSR